MKIIKYKKLSKGKYKITFETSELTLYEDVIINNNLLNHKNITLELLEKLKNENKYYEIYNICLTLIEIKERTENELIENLTKKGFEQDLIENVIEKLKNENYINEKRYIEFYTNDKINLSSYGPYKIKRNLLDLKLDETYIDEYINQIPNEVWKEKLEKIITKKIKLMKNKSLNIIKQKLRIELFNLGYETDMIESALYNIKKDNTETIKKDYQKAYTKYSKKYTNQELTYRIKNYLYQKGYTIEEINEINIE